MPNFIVRRNCEYSITVSAEDEVKAAIIADKVDTWYESHSSLEIETTTDEAEISAKDIPIKSEDNKWNLWSTTVREPGGDQETFIVIGRTEEEAATVAISEFKNMHPECTSLLDDIYSIDAIPGPDGTYYDITFDPES